MKSNELEIKLSNIPALPGVYFFKNRQGKVIYIGKAKILKNRVRSYFQSGRAIDPKLDALVRRIADIEWIVTDSEVEALILEANLVKEYRPRYNVNLKDDKSYPYIRVTKEPFPRVFPTRRIVQDGSRYFGPYTDVHSMRSLLKAIRKIFPVRSCNYKLNEEIIRKRKVKLCLDYHIHRCPGPCEGLISEGDYKKMIQQTVSFIEGKDKEVLAQLEQQMREAASKEEFEKAARLRDQIKSIEVFRAKQKVVSPEDIDRDVIGIAWERDTACGVVFKIRDGKVVGRYHFYLTRNLDQSEVEILQAFLQQFYVKADFIPPEVFVPVAPADSEQLEQWLKQRRSGKVNIVVPTRGEKEKLVRLATNNARLLLEELKLQKLKRKQEKQSAAVLMLQQALRLPKTPERIEAFDISNIAGRDAVASMVSFFRGKPDKANYRRFKIKTVDGIDDFAMMREVVFRRYRRLLEENSPLPDLILIDGGKGQLSSAMAALKELGIPNQPVIALAKRLDEVFLPGVSGPQNVPKDSAALKLLKHIRDESHRFAITYHRKLRSKRQTGSLLDQIPGIGEKRRKKLLESFGSVDNIARADADALAAVPGITRPLAEAIVAFFKKSSDEINIQTDGEIRTKKSNSHKARHSFVK